MAIDSPGRHVVISHMRHHFKASAIPSASAHILIPATIQAQSDDMVMAVYNKLWLLEKELLAELRSFPTYVQTLPLVFQ
jgi:hypothetical protein